MKKILSLFTALVLTVSLAACGAAPAPSDGRLQIVAANFPAYDLARAVCGDAAQVSLLLPPGTESHSYEPTPRNIIDVQNCDLFLYTGGESEEWIETILDSMDHPVNALKMMDCVPLLEEEDPEGAAEHHHEEEHEQGEVLELDEHVWTSPFNAAEILEHIAERIVALDPANAETYVKNENEYMRQLLELGQEFRDFFDGVENPTMVFGDRFPLRYFAEEYGIRCLAAFPGCSAQTEPSAATVAYLTRVVREEKLPAVYYIEFSNHLVADSIAEAAGVETALFHSCHNVSKADIDAGATYLTLMRGNLETLRQTMK